VDRAGYYPGIWFADLICSLFFDRFQGGMKKLCSVVRRPSAAGVTTNKLRLDVVLVDNNSNDAMARLTLSTNLLKPPPPLEFLPLPPPDLPPLVLVLGAGMIILSIIYLFFN